MAAFITNIKRPSVMMVAGNENKTKIGFKKTFSSPKTIATNTEVVNDATVIPDIK